MKIDAKTSPTLAAKKAGMCGMGIADELLEQYNHQTCTWRYLYMNLIDTQIYDSVIVSGW